MPSQKPKPKKSSLQDFKQEAVAYGDRMMQKLFGLTHGWQKNRDIVQNNFNLGLQHLSAGRIRDAVMRFKFVTWFDPKYADGWYYLACSYLAEGKKTLAIESFKKAINLKPGNEEAIYMLAIALGGQMPVDQLPKRIPLSLAQSHFDKLAPNFTREQLETYRYQGHQQLTEAIRAYLTPGRLDHVVLELGVGTGLCGPLLRDVSANITGIDMSAPMLGEAMKVQDAQGRKIYDALINREISVFLQGSPATFYDVVMAAGVLSYIGDVGGIFQQAVKVLKDGGLFAFTADKLDGDGYEFDPAAGRFRFSQQYLRGLASANSLNELKFEEAAVYPGYTSWLCVFGK